jgi:hypothetical protein
VTAYLQNDYDTAYAEIVRRHADRIIVQFFGHTHMFFVSAGTDVFGGVPVVFLGGISPLFGNNPNYALVEVDDAAGTLVSLRQRFLPLDAFGGAATWTNGNSLPSAYNVAAPAGFTSSVAASIAATFTTNTTAYAVWTQMLSGNLTEPLVSCFNVSCRRTAACIAGQSDATAVSKCLDAARSKLPGAPGVSEAVFDWTTTLICLAVLVLAVTGITWWLRRRESDEDGLELDEEDHLEPRSMLPGTM